MFYINALSSCLAERSCDNNEIIQDYYAFGGNPDEEITAESLYTKTGVRRRFISTMDETAKDLGNRASEKLFEKWNIDRSNIDYIIFVSDALEYKGPTTACIMQRDLGLKNESAAIDVLHGCTGFIYGLSLAKAVLQSGLASNVLMVTADVPTKVVHPEDTELRALFSDGAAATLISMDKSNSFSPSIGEFVFGTDGNGEKNLWVERSATREPADVEWLKQYTDVPTGLGGGRMRMESSKIFMFIFRKVPSLIQDILDKNNLTSDDINFYILHQANGTILEFVRKRMNIPPEKFINSIELIGNTVSSSIPIAIDGELKKDIFKPGTKVLIAGFGIGYSWGGTVLSF